MPSVGVVGAGTMGEGITYVFAAAGCPTTVVEPDSATATRLRATLAEQAQQGLNRGKLTADTAAALPALVTVVAAVEDLPEGLDLVVESVPERIDVKLGVLTAVSRRSPTIIATGTSALSIDDLAAGLPDPGAFLGMHFFNPVWSLQLVELIRGAKTSAGTIAAAQRLAALLGKKSIVVNDVAGFATSRLDVIAALEAMRMVEQNVASAEDIDTALTVAYRHPMGPLRLSDVVGLDVRLDIATHLHTVYGERFAPPQILIDLVARGHLGRKSGRGLFTWPAIHTDRSAP